MNLRYLICAIAISLCSTSASMGCLQCLEACYQYGISCEEAEFYFGIDCSGCECPCGGEIDLCGDGFCSVDDGETAETCPADCAECGDAICSPGEHWLNCDDCIVCGDGLCHVNAGESIETCPDDCLPTSVVAWGQNFHGQTDIPLDTNGDPMKFLQVAAGSGHSIGLRQDGSAICWGRNDYGQCDPPDEIFIAICAGGLHSMGLTAEGQLFCWGYNFNGQCNVPDEQFVDMAAGGYHSLGLIAHGTTANSNLIGWGAGTDGQLPNTTKPAWKISAGSYHSVAIMFDGSIRGWGNNSQNQYQAADGPFSSIATGSNRTIALSPPDGSIEVWGHGEPDYGAPWDPLIDEYPGRRYSNFTMVDGGALSTFGLVDDGRILGTGTQDYGLMDIPDGPFRSLSAGSSHVLALKVDLCPDTYDSDGDGTDDCLDECPDDPNKTVPGMCGCGVLDTFVLGDVDCDGDYDTDDVYAAMVDFNIGSDSDCEADANADGVVDVLDLLKVIDGWGLCD